jgi:hypothetical protein
LTEDDLRAAIETGSTWSEAVDLLGIHDVSAVSASWGHAARPGLDFKHLTEQPTASGNCETRPDIAHLDRAGSLLAASWFTLCGHSVSWPLEPSRYDLLVCTDEGIRRVQVKTTTVGQEARGRSISQPLTVNEERMTPTRSMILHHRR